MKLVVQLPALNEEASIGRVLDTIPRSLPGVDEVLVLVVDDGSTDQTAELAREKGAVVVSHAQNRGVGAAFRTGLAKATDLGADIIVTLDADGQFNPDDISTLIEPIQKGKADFVTASRFLDPALVPAMPAAKRWGNDFMAPCRTSRVRGWRTLCDVPCTRLFCSFSFIKSRAGFGAHKSG